MSQTPASETETEDRIQAALENPQNMGEMADADAVGTVGSPDCGDMVRMWLKFAEKDGKKVIDRASFQSFGCQTAIAVASVATQLLAGKTLEEARNLDSTELSKPLGPLPPMKIHCGQMVEGALRSALEAEEKEHAGVSSTGEAVVPAASPPQPQADTLAHSFGAAPKGTKVKIVKLDKEGDN